MNFDNEKKNCLSKIDKSRKGSVDDAVKPLVDLINSKDRYYTTSSCSGRTLLIMKPESGKKNLAEWLFISHDAVDADKMWSVLESESKIQDNAQDNVQDIIWFKKEGMIIHICCRTVEDALLIVAIARDSGLKRTGLISKGNKGSIVEIIDSEKMEVPVAKGGKLLIDKDYFKFLVSTANAKLTNTLKKIKNLEKRIKQED